MVKMRKIQSFSTQNAHAFVDYIYSNEFDSGPDSTNCDSHFNV